MCIYRPIRKSRCASVDSYLSTTCLKLNDLDLEVDVHAKKLLNDAGICF